MAILLNDQRIQPPTPPAVEEGAAEAPRRRDPEATRKAILDAAEELFVERGPDATTTAEIAKAAGVNKSLIHHHFHCKEELWEEVKRRHFIAYFTVQKEMLLASSSQPTAELLRDSLHAFFYFLQGDPKSVRFMSWSFCEQEPSKIDLEKELFELGIERIRASQEAGEIRADIEPLFVIKTFIGLALNWFQTCRLTLSMIDSDIEPRALDALYLDTATKILLDGVRPPRA